MYPILIDWGFITIHSYGVMVALGFLVGIFLTFFLAQKEKLNPNKILDLAIVVMISAILGARLFYVIEFWRDFAGRPWEILMIWHGGLVFYGGLIVAVIATLIFLRKNRLPFWKVLDLAALGTALGMAIGRIGCFLNGCCYGIETQVPWAVKFPHLPGLRHPTQLYSSFNLIVIFVVLFLFYRVKPKAGLVFAGGLILYSLHRFLVEFLRTNPRYLLGMSEAQMISVLLFIVGIWIFLFLKNKHINA